MINFFCEAIKERKRVELQYDGGGRLIEPHCCGYGSSGQELLRCWQVEGFSKSNEATGWKLFRLEKVTGARTVGTFSDTRPGYNHEGDQAIPEVLCKL